MKKTDSTTSKILLYDIETSYTVGAVWGLYEQNVAQVLQEPYIISFAWKWLGEKTTHVMSIRDFPTSYKKDKTSDKLLVGEMWKLFNAADVIVAHNGNSFDQKWTYARMAVHGMTPPSPSKYIDTKLVAKSKFRFNSNSLNNLGLYFNLGAKLNTGGIGLWVDCIEHDKPEAWKKMMEYNKQDVILLEKVYLRMLPWISGHPNRGLMEGKIEACPNCGKTSLQKRGYSYTRTCKYQRFQCTDCGAWSSARKSEKVPLAIK